MNSTPQSSNCTRLVWQLGGILAASVALGLAYNNASPLGLKTASEERTEAPISDITRAIRSIPPPTTVRTGYFNETVAMNLELPNSPAPSIPQAAPAPVQPTPTAVPADPAHGHMTFPPLKWPEVKAMLAAKSIILVDARLKANYDVSHIPGSISLPATSPATDLQAFATKYPKDTHFVVYCGSQSCHMSRSLAENLVKICGYTNVSEMPGGFAEFIIAEPGGGTKATP